MKTTLLNNAITTRTYNSSCFSLSLYFRSFQILKISQLPLIFLYEAIKNMTWLFLIGSRIVTRRGRGGTCNIVYECVTSVVKMNQFSVFLFEFRLLNFGDVYYVIVLPPVAQNSRYFQNKIGTATTTYAFPYTIRKISSRAIDWYMCGYLYSPNSAMVTAITSHTCPPVLFRVPQPPLLPLLLLRLFCDMMRCDEMR